MQFERDFAQRFREAADMMRAIAAGETNVKESGILDRIAEEYEHTAADLEDLDRTSPDAPAVGEGEVRDSDTRAA